MNANDTLNDHLRDIIKTLLPDTYAEYDKIFQAGKFFHNDPGPFLGRAVMPSGGTLRALVSAATDWKTWCAASVRDQPDCRS